MANRKIENLLEVYSNISMAREIAHATLLELSNNMDENNDRYIVLGVIDQLKIIGEALKLFDETMTVKSNVTNDTPDIYNSSELMKMIGKSNASETHVEEIQDIANAKNITDSDALMFGCDTFNCGFIYGKREERANKQETDALTQDDNTTKSTDEKEWYKEKIIEKIKQCDDLHWIRTIYAYLKVLLK